MKNENTTATVDTTGVSEWWFTRNIIAGFLGIAASLSLNIAISDSESDHSGAGQPASHSVAFAAK
jgi:hypothetical protein